MDIFTHIAERTSQKIHSARAHESIQSFGVGTSNDFSIGSKDRVIPFFERNFHQGKFQMMQTVSVVRNRGTLEIPKLTIL